MSDTHASLRPAVPRGKSHLRPRGRRLPTTSAVVVVVGVACAATVATGWHSPVRVALAIGFLLFGPGLALAELLDVRDPFTRLAVATGASLAVDTIVALILVYAGAFSTLLALVLLLLVTVCAAVGTVLRPGPTNGFAVEQSRRDP